MAVIETWIPCDLQEAVKVTCLDGNLFSHNADANRIGAVVTNGGVPVNSLTGTVTGYAVLSDGTTVPCTASKSGNRASVLLPASAYLPGVINISVFLTDGNSVTTLAAVTTTVLRTRTETQVDPGQAVSDWTDTINAAMQAVETAAENVGSMIAVPYAGMTFPVPLGKYTFHNNNIYRCIVPIPTSEIFTASHWEQVHIGDDVEDINNLLTGSTAYDDVVDIPYVIDGSGYVKATDGTIASSSNFSHTGYVDVHQYSHILYKRSKSTNSHPLTGIALYDGNKQYITGFYSQELASAAGYMSELQDINVALYNAKYVRFSVYSNTSTYGDFELKGKTNQNEAIRGNSGSITGIKTFSGITTTDSIFPSYRVAGASVGTWPDADIKRCFYSDSSSGVCYVMNPTADSDYHIIATGNSRLRVYGVLEYIDASDFGYCNMTVNTIIESEDTSEVRFNSGTFKTVIVYLNVSTNPDARCTVYKVQDRSSASTVPIESYLIYGGISGTNPDGTKTFRPTTAGQGGRSSIFNPRKNTNYLVTATNNNRLRIYGTTVKFNASDFMYTRDIIVDVINESEVLAEATFNSGNYETIFIYLDNVQPTPDVTCSVVESVNASLLGHINNIYGNLREAETDITRIQFDYTPIGEFYDAVKYTVDPSTLGVSYGGVYATGVSYVTDTRIRLLSDMGVGGIKVGKGSRISANTGFKYNMALYSSYVNNQNFTLVDYVPMTTQTYEIPYDCYVRIAIGTVNDDVLWTQDSDGMYTLTPEGQAAFSSGLSLTLFSGSIKDELQTVEAQIGYNVWDNVNLLDEDIPINAVAYHAKYTPLVEAGYISRTLLGNVDDDEDLPIYLYTLRNDMDHMNSGYSIIPWDGSNQLYNRPKIFLDSGIHGNERTTPFALYDFIYKLCNDPNYQDMRNAFDWYFIPLVNPWGFSHSAKQKNSSVITDGSGYNSANKNDYDILDNTETVHQGIRRNADGIDINRDFSAFETQEAQIVRTALQQLTADNRDFIFAIDSHQAATGNYVNVIGAFLSLHYGADQAAKDFMWAKWMQAGAKTEMSMSNYCDRPQHQSVYTWEGTNLMTARNYMAAYADYSMCFEGGQTCVYYSQSTEWSNRITRALVNTQYHSFLHILTGHWM